MGFPFNQVLPVLRTPAIARQDAATFHLEIPGDRVAATPWAAFTTGQGLLTKAEVTSSGVRGQELFEKARENLIARAPKWNVEARIGADAVFPAELGPSFTVGIPSRCAGVQVRG